MGKVKSILNKFAYRGVVMAVVSGVLGVLIAMGVIDQSTKVLVMENAELVLGFLVAIGLIRTRNHVKEHKHDVQKEAQH